MKKIIVLLVAAILVLAGCSGNKGTVITFWNPFAGADGETMTAIIDDFNTQYEGVYYIEQMTVANDGNAYYDKINTAYQSGDAPDLAIMHIDSMPTYANAGMLKPWTQEDLDAMGLDASQYSESLVEAAHYNEELYSIPLDVHPIVLWVNTDLVPVEEIPTNQEEFKAFVESGEEGAYTFAWSSNPFIQIRTLYSAFLQNDVPIVSEDGSTALYNTEEAVNILTTVQEMSAAAYTPAPGEDVGNLFMTGGIATQVEGIWMKNAYEDAGLNVTAVPISNFFGDTSANWASSHTFVKFNKEYTPEVEAGIQEFVKFVISESLTWAETGQIPANTTYSESEEFKAMEIQYSVAQEMDSFVFYPSVVSKDAILAPLERVSNEVYLGQKDAQTALDEAQAEADQKAAEVLN